MFKFFFVFVIALVAISSAEEEKEVQIVKESSEVEEAVVELNGIADDNRGLTQLNGTIFRCPFREEFLDCPEAHKCQQTCATLNHACLITPTCTSACFCRQGYARDQAGRCVPISDCPGKGFTRLCNQSTKILTVIPISCFRHDLSS